MKNIILFLLTFILFVSCKNTTTKTDEYICEFYKPLEVKQTQEKPGKQNISELIPPGYTIVKRKTGEELIYTDLNKDGQNDAVVLIKMRGDTSFDLSQEVLLMIYTADRHGQLQMATASGNLGGEAILYNDGGKSLSVKNQVISYHHQSMRHHMDLKFRYEIKAGDFMLIGKDYADYGGIEDGPSTVSINYLTGVKLINNSKWDDETEEVVELPQVKEFFKKPLQSLSSINWDRMYDDL